MIDFHTHVLPQIDDGSKSIEMSQEMIKESINQGVDVIVATPHFYPNVEDIDTFIQRRNKSFDKLINEVDINLIKGAEIQYFAGISRNEDILKLAIENSNVLLVEMPFNLRFDKSMINEIIDLSKKCKVVLAHFERYLDNNSLELFENLAKCGIVLQVNANSFNRFFVRRKLIKMLKDGYVLIIASDMHNTSTRPQNIKSAIDLIDKKCAQEVSKKLIDLPYSLLKIGVK